jgi:hypothetical protein
MSESHHVHFPPVVMPSLEQQVVLQGQKGTRTGEAGSMSQLVSPCPTWLIDHFQGS